ncbi:MAG: hypothetical protein NC924_05590 [Candidatus Omnitrophica bacterium]|nr:hypothetical protein [Candidatus Omnitrophota bacterium]
MLKRLNPIFLLSTLIIFSVWLSAGFLYFKHSSRSPTAPPSPLSFETMEKDWQIRANALAVWEERLKQLIDRYYRENKRWPKNSGEIISFAASENTPLLPEEITTLSFAVEKNGELRCTFTAIVPSEPPNDPGQTEKNQSVTESFFLTAR